MFTGFFREGDWHSLVGPSIKSYILSVAVLENKAGVEGMIGLL